MPRMDLLLTRTMTVPSRKAVHTNRVPGFARVTERMSSGRVICPLAAMIEAVMPNPFPDQRRESDRPLSVMP